METRYVETVTNVSIEWILKNVNASVDGYSVCNSKHGKHTWECSTECEWEVEWGDLVEYKFDDTDSDTLDSIMRHGIRNPICLQYGAHGVDRFRQGNGHHRLAIAIMLGLDSIPVVFSFNRFEYMMGWITAPEE